MMHGPRLTINLINMKVQLLKNKNEVKLYIYCWYVVDEHASICVARFYFILSLIDGIDLLSLTLFFLKQKIG
jgi:hypothetical protein